jgi:hypothetical protein
MDKVSVISIKGKNGILRIRRTLFWDIDMNMIEAERNSKLIIERVFTRGNVNEFIQIMKYYDQKTIKQLIIKAGYLDKKTLNFASKLFEINKTDFLCYKKRL